MSRYPIEEPILNYTSQMDGEYNSCFEELHCILQKKHATTVTVIDSFFTMTLLLHLILLDIGNSTVIGLCTSITPIIMIVTIIYIMKQI